MKYIKNIIKGCFIFGFLIFIMDNTGIASEILYQDSFSKGENNGWIERGGKWSLEDGWYVQSGESKYPNDIISLYTGKTFANFQLTAKLVFLNDSEYAGIAFRAIDSNYHYILAISPYYDKIQLDTDVIHSYSAGSSVTIDVGVPYWIRVKCVDENIEGYFSIDGVKFTKYIDTKCTFYRSGYIGLYVCANSHVKFKDVVVTSIESEEEPKIFTDYPHYKCRGTKDPLAIDGESKTLEKDSGIYIWWLLGRNLSQGNYKVYVRMRGKGRFNLLTVDEATNKVRPLKDRYSFDCFINSDEYQEFYLGTFSYDCTYSLRLSDWSSKGLWIDYIYLVPEKKEGSGAIQ